MLCCFTLLSWELLLFSFQSGNEPRAFHIPGKGSTNELHPSSRGLLLPFAGSVYSFFPAPPSPSPPRPPCLLLRWYLLPLSLLQLLSSLFFSLLFSISPSLLLPSLPFLCSPLFPRPLPFSFPPRERLCAVASPSGYLAPLQVRVPGNLRVTLVTG